MSKRPTIVNCLTAFKSARRDSSFVARGELLCVNGAKVVQRVKRLFKTMMGDIWYCAECVEKPDEPGVYEVCPRAAGGNSSGYVLKRSKLSLIASKRTRQGMPTKEDPVNEVRILDYVHAGWQTG